MNTQLLTELKVFCSVACSKIRTEPETYTGKITLESTSEVKRVFSFEVVNPFTSSWPEFSLTISEGESKLFVQKGLLDQAFLDNISLEDYQLFIFLSNQLKKAVLFTRPDGRGYGRVTVQAHPDCGLLVTGVGHDDDPFHNIREYLNILNPILVRALTKVPVPA